MIKFWHLPKRQILRFNDHVFVRQMILFGVLWIACTSTSCKNEISARQPSIQKPLGKKIETRIQVPSGYTRTKVTNQSFGYYLRNLPLKPEGSEVLYYDGRTKSNHGVYCAVVDLDIGSKDLHQCADAVMRLRATHLWEQKKYDHIHFNFTNGFKVEFKEWMKGRRMVVEGNRTYWDNRDQLSNSYEDFWNYMELIFMYAGTASLEKEMLSIPVEEMTIGDVLIQGGHPGHAVIVVDQAKNKQGESIYLLAQSYMPAQEIQILSNPIDKGINPWYGLDKELIQTPEWSFYPADCKRFMAD